MNHRILPFLSVIALLSTLAGCWSPASNEVVVYTAQDADFAEPVFAEFGKQSGIAVRAKYDAESTKTVGFVTAIVEEANRPRCDLFWNNEILNTLRLEKRGLLEPFTPENAADYPAKYRSPQGLWYGFAARARILLVNKQLVPQDQRPKSIDDLADPKWRGKTGMAKPLFGTTATHAACLFAMLGDERAKTFFRSLKQNEIHIEAGNKQVAVDVGAGKLAFGVTDTDDALEEIRGGSPVEIIYPDQQPGGLGTLFIPNTLAMVKGCPHPAAAAQLANYLLSAEVEGKLATGASSQIPLNPKVKAKPAVETPATIRAMDVDFPAAADRWDETAKFLREEFTGAE